MIRIAVLASIALVAAGCQKQSSTAQGDAERVAVVPGSAFGACGEGYVRACYASGYEQIERALERIGRFVQRHRRD